MALRKMDFGRERVKVGKRGRLDEQVRDPDTGRFRKSGAREILSGDIGAGGSLDLFDRIHGGKRRRRR